jgi:hypothetical protein
MKKIIIKHFVHDSHIFYYTEEAIAANKEIIGFYFDDLGFPQIIHKKSIYGHHIIRAEGTPNYED